MNKKSLIVLFLLCSMISLTGCASYEWRHPTKTQADFDRDKIQCEYEAQKATAYYAYDFVAQVEQAKQRTQIFNMCMQTKGYYMAKHTSSSSSSRSNLDESAKGVSEALVKSKNAQKATAVQHKK